MRNRQAGVTFLGWIILLTPFAIVGYAGMRLAPIYLNYMKVARACDQAAADVKTGGASSAQALKLAIDKHFEIDMVDYPTTKDFKFTREGQTWVIEAAYDDEAPLFGNVSMHVLFDKVVRVGGGGE
jgi:Domain of unknown function (DUF4845)